MEIFKTLPQVKFLKYKYIALIITAVIVLAGMLNIFVGRGLKLGVDFGEGTLIRVIFKNPTLIAEVRKQLEDVGLGNSPIQELGKNGREFQIRAVEVKNIKDENVLESHADLGNKIIAALRGTDGQSETAQGLKDLNSIDQKSLASLLEPAFTEKGAGLAEQVLSARKNEANQGAFADYADLSRDGVPAEVVTFLKGKTFLGKLNILSLESVGPQVGKDLRKKAVLATIWSLIGMLIYIAVRFKLANGVAAIFTLTQDVLITISLYSFSGREVNLPIIAALLTIVGFSINDTIVIFDRIRENQKAFRKMPLEEIMNLSLNQMLGRTFITSGTVFLTVMALFIFGGPVINDFAFCMLIGTIEGVYSTIYLACPVVLFWQKWFPSKRARR
ncbi:MAG: protein translocase subunit SecF [Candidatus Aminicenantes bacterium]|nr:protein translocase subunit SecF [Candidatus Aminicenantes bacterium]